MYKGKETERKNGYGIILKEVPGMYGLKESDYRDMYAILNSEEAYPLEIEAREHESSAMGLISPEAADKLDYDYDNSGLKDYVAGILDDMELESENGEYVFKGILMKIYR